jgi:hypothetical protein
MSHDDCYELLRKVHEELTAWAVSGAQPSYKGHPFLRSRIFALLAKGPPQPAGWLTEESKDRLLRGGNQSRGTVPLHRGHSAKSAIPVYFDSQNENE